MSKLRSDALILLSLSDAMTEWNEAERRVERAQEFFEQHKWPEALEELRAAISINPYNSGWFFNLGLTLDELDRPQEAIDAYEQALAIDGNDLQAMNHLGVDLHRIGRLDEALRTFERIENLDPSFEACYCNRIITYTELGEHEKADEMFYLARLYKEECPHCFYNIACSLAARGQYDRAIYCWRKTLDLEQQHPGVHARIAEAFWSKGEHEQSRRHFLAALREDPGSIPTLLDLADLLIEMGRLDEAGEKIRRSIEMAPDQPAAHYAHGRWLDLQGQEERAAAAFLKTLRLDPTFPGAHLHLARLYQERHEPLEVRRHLRGELLLKPEDTRILLNMANLLMDVGELRLAVATLKRLVQLEPRNISAWINLAVAQFKRRRYHDGIDACREALRRDPHNMLATYNLALAQQHIGNLDEAWRWISAGLNRDPFDPAFQRLQFRLRVLRLRRGVARAIGRALYHRGRG